MDSESIGFNTSEHIDSTLKNSAKLKPVHHIDAGQA